MIQTTQNLLLIVLSVSILFLSNAVADPIDNSTCMDCHEDMGESLKFTFHKLEIGSPEINCISCHAGGDIHIEDPSVDNITYNDQLCNSCHESHLSKVDIGFNSHVQQNLLCADCHTVHNASMVRNDKQICEKCHVSVLNSFRKRSNHPAIDGNVTCVGCHDFTGKNEPSVGHGTTTNCVNCHPEQQGPYLFEHEATSSFTPEGNGCIACHDPHGSPNDRLLTQTDDRLCRQCHFQSTQHTATAHSGEYAGNRCIDCHSQVHGSFETKNRFLLDPDLGMKLGGSLNSCYCHNQN